MHLALLCVGFVALTIFVSAVGAFVYQLATGWTCCYGPDPRVRIATVMVAAGLVMSVSTLLSAVVQ